ncbi:MAG: SDR family NAD(P)-dependent oxidoreductase, partial [Pseudomonadota bacterium]
MEKVALITGASRRIGKTTCETLHRAGYRVVIHYLSSKDEAEALSAALNESRPRSAITAQADLHSESEIENLVSTVIDAFGRLDLLVNNASTFYPTALGDVSAQHWLELMGSNLKAPLFLSKFAAPSLQQTRGCIINIIDIYADRPLSNHHIYTAAKAGLANLTKSLARDLAPAVRVN